MEYLHQLSDPADLDGVVEVRPSVWLMSSEELPPLLFSVDEAARCLGIGRHKVFDLIREGELRSIKVGGSRRVSARALSAYVANLEAVDLT